MTGSATPNAMGASTGLGLACNATNIAAQSRHATNCKSRYDSSCSNWS